MTNRNFGPQRRPLTARERSIRAKYGLLFVISSICAISLASLYNKEKNERLSYQEENKILDSAYANLDYAAFFYDKDSSIVYYEHNDEGEDTIHVMIPNIDKIRRIASDAKLYREISDDLFELRSNDTRYQMALEYYADPLMHQEYRDRTGSDFKSRYTPKERKEIVEKILKESESFNSLYRYGFAFDWYREIDPVAIKEIEVFLFFTE
jgi:hypothetical protein